MKYFEKDASIGKAFKGITTGFLDKKQAISRVARLEEKQMKLRQLEHLDPKKFYRPETQKRLKFRSEIVRGSHAAINRMELDRFKFGAAPVHPMQGTMLNVQTRDSQRKYKSKILGKKRADILVPLWS